MLTLAAARRSLMMRVVSQLDLRLQAPNRLEDALRAKPAPLRVYASQKVALVGHRGAGKSRVMRLVSAWCGRKAVDLDSHLEHTHRRSIREWFAADSASFREAEREAFLALPDELVVSCGGGFLALHADLLRTHQPVLVPVSFETYAERLRNDRRRPRIRPELPLEEELRQVFIEREILHAQVKNLLELPEFLVRTFDPEVSFS